MDAFLEVLGDKVQDVDEELFDLFSQTQSSQDLGMVDPKAAEVEISIGERDFTIMQSPGVLQSRREGGTTGAALWRACVRFAEWIGSSNNVLFKHAVLDSSSIVLELGSGISGLVPSMLSPRVGRVIATDQQYAIKLLQENIHANIPSIKPKAHSRKGRNVHSKPENIDVIALDWETDDVNSLLRSNGFETGVDAVLACDCIFNYALIGPLVQTCLDICKARVSLEDSKESAKPPSLCIVAQQLRQPEVFEEWLQAFTASFHTWRIPNSVVGKGLGEGSGFVVHVGILRKYSS